MSTITIGIIGMIILFLLMALGVPIGLSMALVGIVGFAILVSIKGALFQAASIPFNLVTSYSFCVLPLFIFMAQVIFESGFSKDIYQLANKWLGRIPGGLALATVVSCALFAAVSSSSIASAITMGLVAIPEMKRYKYEDGLSCATVVAGGTLGILIPPSGILIVYGILTEQSIGKLFIAGIIPGIILSLMFMLLIYIRARLNPKLAPAAEPSTPREKILALGRSVEILLLIVIIIGGLLFGWFSPTQAGAVGAFGALVMAIVRKRLTLEKFQLALFATLRNTGMIFVILIGALILNVFLAVSKIPIFLADSISASTLPPVAVLGIMLLIYLVLGCFIDAMAMVILTIPIFYPIVIALGFDPIFFGILVVIAVEMACITPPIGMNVFAISGVAKEVPMGKIFKSAIPFVITMVVFVIILIAFPQIALFLPNYFGL